VVSELELLRIRRANIVCVLWCCGGCLVRVVDQVQTREALSFELAGFAWSFAFGEAESAGQSR
jgi:hypothetical protein